MDYREEILDNYQELKTKHPRVAAELLDKFGEGRWQEYAIFYYPTKEDYAAYELEDGWYADFGLNENTDFYGAPNLLDHIDFASLADALIDTWDDSSKYQTESGEIVASAWGF